MRIEAIAVGTELLTSSRLDTNSVWMAERLAELGLSFHRKSIVGDDPADLKALFTESLQRSEVVLVCGGLGPTFDDLTRECWAEVLGVPLEEDPGLREGIESFFRLRGRPLPESNLRQALVPRGAQPLPNPVGTAPGLLFDLPAPHHGKRVFLLPGVPREMKALWEREVHPRLRPLAAAPAHTLRLLVGSVGESALDERTRPLREKHGDLDWTILAHLGLVELLARHPDPEKLEAARRDFEQELGLDRICTGPESLEETVLHLLRSRGETLALAESMTGGRIASLLCAVPGASEAMAGGAVVYTPTSKHLLAGLSREMLETHGTVSAPTTRELARGIRDRLGATWGLAVTGNAGPDADPNGTAPVGTSYIAVSGPSGETGLQQHFPGARIDQQVRSSLLALDALRRRLQEAP